VCSRATRCVVEQKKLACVLHLFCYQPHQLCSHFMPAAAAAVVCCRVPEGTILYLPLTHVALNDPRFVEQQPEAFIPERMLTPEGMKQGAQIPFGHGPRCVHGMCVHVRRDGRARYAGFT
jgi:hypothetical protein